ncbi:MAG: uroporphyrinogen-III synthase, partial [Xanthomonadaceae bacterium]|nr:uroporphyrinogen-III synthase [Xanthomonadaceae bacterium]
MAWRSLVTGALDVVVTRPEPDHAALLTAVERRGCRPIHCPAFRLDSADPDRVRRDFLSGSGFDRLIVTSPMAARILLEAVSAARLAGTALLAPGEGTAGVLQAAGLHVDVPVSGATSEDLLRLPGLESVGGLAIAIAGAPGGRALLGQQLGARGARITRLNVYRRVAR